MTNLGQVKGGRKVEREQFMSSGMFEVNDDNIIQVFWMIHRP